MLAALLACVPPHGGSPNGVVADTARASPRKRADEIAWTAGPALPAARDHHATFITTTQSGSEGFLWVAGGNNYRMVLGDVWRMKLNALGAPVGEWTPGDTLPVALAGPGVATTGRTVIVAGGQDAHLQKRRDVFVAVMRADGTLGPWIQGPPLPFPAFHHSLTVWHRWVYATGGISARVSTANVARAEVNGDGSLGSWDTLPALDRARSHHAAFILRDRLCVAGGIDGDPAGEAVPLNDIECAPLHGDGLPGAWTRVSTLPRAIATHSVVVESDRIVLLGGVIDNRAVTDEVWSANLDRGGNIGPWVATTSLPRARSHVHQTPLWNGRIYSVGGSANRIVSSELWIGSFPR